MNLNSSHMLIGIINQRVLNESAESLILAHLHFWEATAKHKTLERKRKEELEKATGDDEPSLMKCEMRARWKEADGVLYINSEAFLIEHPIHVDILLIRLKELFRLKEFLARLQWRKGVDGCARSKVKNICWRRMFACNEQHIHEYKFSMVNERNWNEGETRRGKRATEACWSWGHLLHQHNRRVS